MGKKHKNLDFYADQMVLYARMKIGTIGFVQNVDEFYKEKN